MTQDWSDPRLRSVKRALSVYEKSSIIMPIDRALIMAGEPPRPGYSGEVEELLAAGYAPQNINIVECEPNLANELYDNYFDSMAVHLDRVERFIPRATQPYGYMHIDLCGLLLPDVVDGIQSWKDCAGRCMRVRVSLARTRKIEAQQNYEAQIRSSVISHFCKEVQKIDRHPQRWDSLINDMVHGTDSTQIVGFMWILNFMFGIKLFDYGDAFVIDGPHLPRPLGRHVIHNLRRFDYKDFIGHTAMSTIWADIITADADGPISSKEWLVDELVQLMQLLVEPAPSFNNVDLFT